MQIDILPIHISHVPGFHRAVDTVCRERKYLPSLEAPPLPATYEFVQKNIEEGRSQLVAIHGSDVVGWCDILPRHEPVRQHVGVLGMGLLPDYRNRGLGGRLLKETLDDASRQGFRKIELTVRASNLSAIQLYKAAGFHLEGTLKDNIFLDGQFDNTLCMALFPE